MMLYLTDLGIACALGQNKEEVAQHLFAKTRRSFSKTHRLFSGKKVPVGALPFELSTLPKSLQSLNSRNNRLLKRVLDEIAPAIEQVKKTSQRLGVVMATSTSGMAEGETAFAKKIRTGAWPDTYTYQQQETASPSLFASQYFNITGPSYTVSTACSAGAKALFSAKRLIETDICDAVICGGVDTLCDLTLNGFDSLDLVSGTPCQPFDKNRDGITIGEGAAVFILSKEPGLSCIQLLGTGESSDAHHISSPDPEGKGAAQAITQALQGAQLTPQDIAYINLHGTGTLLNDAMESRCVHTLFGKTTPCSSTKALTGHTLGASGAIEAGFLWLMLDHITQTHIPLPPHHGLETIDPDLPIINLVSPDNPLAKVQNFAAIMSNSFAFGGSNASLILGRTWEVPHD